MVGTVSRGQRLLSVLLAFLFASSIYLYAFPQANVPYAGAVLAHAFVGVLALAWLIFMLPAAWRRSSTAEKVGLLLTLVGGTLGVILIRVGTSRPELKIFYAHILVCLAGFVAIASCRIAERGWLVGRPAVRALATLLMFASLGAGGWYVRARFQKSARIQNPALPPASMDGEGDGPGGKFFPSSAQVKGGGNIPSRFFMESESCKRCHEDIYNQWNSSAHHFSSFNNQWYRKSIEYMQEVVGTKPSKWCGGCHDPAVLYSGLMDTPIKEIVHRPEAQAGLGCMMCHAITDVKSTMGQGDFILEYPTLHELAATKNPVLRAIHDFTIKLNPEPHRRVFLKPFMKNQVAEFCSSCHKVHLDVPVNHYRWVRGFNEYDNWQASGVSFQGARSFYYPAQAQDCADCHMPKIQSNDFGNIAGNVHSHRFVAANTALPVANEDTEQLKATEDFLTSKILSVDIFALSPAREMKSGGTVQQEMSTDFAVGEEAEAKIAAADTGEAVPVTAPLNRVQPVVRRGDTVLVDVVVRTRRVGHFFPGGTIDAYDTWVELKGTDDKGQTVFWSGMIEDKGKGPVEKGAHFYRSLMVDSAGNRINKRNAFATRAVVYVRLIPPGAADTVHYRMHIPANAGNKITLHARLLYRKFEWYNTQFAFAGVPDPNHKNAEVTPDHDDRHFVFTGNLSDVSAKKKEIPDLPAVTIAEDEVTLNVASAGSPAPQPKVELAAEDWTRWNDYGIGLFLQGDLKAAQAAFQKITEIDPKNADGWVNLGRVAAQEGDMDRAAEVVGKALALQPNLARAHFFYARVLRNNGQYDEAAQHLRTVLAQYPRDRVVRNELGRVFFLQRRYQDAIKEFETTLSIDPEDLQAHYNLMLCYNGLGDETRAKEHEQRYMRFKADEASQALTGAYRRLNPEDNNERQQIHEHVSVPLPILAQSKLGSSRTALNSRKKTAAPTFAGHRAKPSPSNPKPARPSGASR